VAAVAATAAEQGACRPLRSRFSPLLLALGLCLPALAPLGLAGFVEGHDGIEHVFRVLALATAWRQYGVVGNLLPRWTSNLALGFGYPLFGVYSPLAYFFPAGLTLLGVAPVLAIKLAVALALLLGGLGVYLCLRTPAGAAAAIAGAVTYVYAPYTLANAYVRLDLAELSAASCAALALAAVLRLDRAERRDDQRRSLVGAALLLAAVPLCHNLSVLTFLPLFGSVWCWLMWRALQRGPRAERTGKVARLVAAPLLAAGLAAFFLLPAWQWQSFTHLALIPDDPAFYAKLLHPWALAQRHFAVAGWGWFAGGSSWWNFSVAPGALGEFGAGPSTPAWLAAPVSLLLIRSWLRRGRADQAGFALALLAACLVSLLLITSLALPFWRAFAHLTLLQFPWRFAGPLCLASALLLALVLSTLQERWRVLGAAGCIVLAILPALLYLRPNAVNLPADAITWPVQTRRELVGGYGTTGSGLFLPRWAPGQSPNVPIAANSFATPSSLHVTALAGRADAFTLTYQAPQATRLTLGTWYFPGWRAQVDGQSVAMAPDPSGLLRLAVPAGTHRLTVRRGLTTAELAGGGISLAATLVCLLLLFGFRRPGAISAVVAVLVVGALSGAVPALSFAALSGRGATPVWSLPAQPAAAGPLQVAAWRVVRSPAWGTTPVLEVAWLTQQTPVGDEQATIRLLSPAGQVLAGSTRGPRLGTAHPAGWPAGMLALDHVPIPLPPTAPGGRCNPAAVLTLTIGAGPATVLGPATLPCAGAGAPAIPQVSVLGLQGLAPGRLPTLLPGATIRLDVSFHVGGPTSGDEVVVLQLLDTASRPIAQTQSYGNVDLRFSTLWTAGETIPYHFRLPLPGTLAPGLYTLSLQRYSPLMGAVQPLAGSSGTNEQRLILATGKVAAPLAPPALVAAERFGPALGLLAPAAPPLPVVTARPGATISVPLRWLAVGAPARDATVFVHLVDATGKLAAQDDGPPLGGRYPTSAWGAGEVVADPRLLRLPANLPPGRYTVHVGWYLPATGARLAASPPTPNDAVPVETVVVRIPATAP
jgi:hypothetical protein